jgi:hypothetical protein
MRASFANAHQLHKRSETAKGRRQLSGAPANPTDLLAGRASDGVPAGRFFPIPSLARPVNAADGTCGHWLEGLGM